MSTETSLLRLYLSLHGRSVCCPCCCVFLTDKANSVASHNPPQLSSQCCICHFHRPRLILGLAAQVKVNVIITEGVARFEAVPHSTSANKARELILSCAQGGLPVAVVPSAQHQPAPMAPFMQLRAPGYSNKYRVRSAIKNVRNVQLLV